MGINGLGVTNWTFTKINLKLKCFKTKLNTEINVCYIMIYNDLMTTKL